MLSYSLESVGVSKSLAFIILYFPVILASLHAFWTLSFFRGAFFILISIIVAFIIEYLGLKYHLVFGGEYIYNLPGPQIFNVPVFVLMYWFVSVYMSYAISNSFIYWLKIEKPTIQNHKTKTLLALIILDIIIVLFIDLFMDPLRVLLGDWVWVSGGSYFNVPLGNFLGWIIVVFIIVTIFRTFEYKRPGKIKQMNNLSNLLPIFGYLLMYLSLVATALRFELYSLIFIGTATMLSIVVINIYSYIKFVKST